MEHLNFCRHMVKQLTQISAIPSIDNKMRVQALHLIDLSNASQKFMLPAGGILLDDDELRALDGAAPMRLPHPFVALEYCFKESGGKVITFAREHLDSASIAVTPMFYAEANGCWSHFPTFFIPTEPDHAITSRDQNRAHLNFVIPESIVDAASKQVCIGAASVVLAFLNALQCANVHTERIQPRKAKGKRIKAALPFDACHVLVIDAPGRAIDGFGFGCQHRSPREHLRRGHIRRLVDGRRIWVNATVVAAGRGAGVVTKSYAVRCASSSQADNRASHITRSAS